MTEHYSDPLDIASDNEQIERDSLVAHIRAQIKPIVQSDVCLNCEMPTENGARWCNKACCDDYSNEPSRLDW